eukprot:760642-Hanusia_phi.AAC.1
MLSFFLGRQPNSSQETVDRPKDEDVRKLNNVIREVKIRGSGGVGRGAGGHIADGDGVENRC